MSLEMSLHDSRARVVQIPANLCSKNTFEHDVIQRYPACCLHGDSILRTAIFTCCPVFTRSSTCLQPHFWLFLGLAIIRDALYCGPWHTRVPGNERVAERLKSSERNLGVDQEKGFDSDRPLATFSRFEFKISV